MPDQTVRTVSDEIAAIRERVGPKGSGGWLKPSDARLLLAEIDERDASFDLRWRADMRAIKAWQAAHPGKELIWPDHVDLVLWLMEQLDALTKAEA